MCLCVGKPSGVRNKTRVSKTSEYNKAIGDNRWLDWLKTKLASSFLHIPKPPFLSLIITTAITLNQTKPSLSPLLCLKKQRKKIISWIWISWPVFTLSTTSLLFNILLHFTLVSYFLFPYFQFYCLLLFSFSISCFKTLLLTLIKSIYLPQMNIQ